MRAAIPAGPALENKGLRSMKTTMTALALILVSAPAAYAAGSLTNESFIEQIGSGNDATITQKNGNNGQATFQAGKKNSVITDQVSKLAGGKNTSGNVQVGKGNTASTGQTNTPPNSQFTTATFTNNSFSGQYGTKNDVIVDQSGGKNSQGALQVGKKNVAGVAQSDTSVTAASATPVGGANTSFTGQFGNKNTAAAIQTSADGTGSGGQFETGHSNASAAVQIGDKNEAGTQQTSVGGRAQGPRNVAATVQVGHGNLETTTQGGSVAGAFGATTEDQVANYTNASFLSQVGTKNVAQIDQENGANTQATFQVGAKNNATIDQQTQTFGTGNGANNAVTTQIGTKNMVNVGQSMAVPLALGNNNSLITQIGGSNVVNAAQSVGQQAVAGNNTQVALQVGTGNSLSLVQATGANVTNTSFTAQYGSHNSASVSQR
ncbi:hypothetical protein [Bradyrhizobium sp. STM 3562]|uniref:hypothetical protein n=1 Tax=Bradyrhizobium sp. STM 3562 TaxID=578924 RepID=UPI00388DBA3F